MIKYKNDIFSSVLIASMLIAPLYAKKTNIAVLQFDAANISEAEVRVLTDRLRTELIKLGIFNIIERGVMEEVLQEQGFQQTGCVSDECVVEVGKLVGVEQMIAGSIGKIGSIYTISARMIDVETGSILSQKSLDCSCPIETILTESMAQVAAGLSGIGVVKPVEPSPPILGSVEFNSDKDSVAILIDGEVKGYTPLVLNDLMPGEYEFSAEKPSFRKYTSNYTIEAGKQTDITIELFRREGKLSITPHRQGQKFQLLIGDQVFDNIGRKTLLLPEGDYNITIKEFGYYDLTESVTVSDQEITTIKANNTPILVPVIFQIFPSSSIVKLDGKIVDVPSGGKFELLFGNHQAVANAPKYEKKSTTFTIDKDSPFTIDLRLESKSKSKAKWLSTLIPGSGQIYSENLIRGVAYLLLTAGSLALLNATYDDYYDARGTLDAYREDYRQAQTTEDIILTRGLYQTQVNKVNDLRGQLTAYGIVLGVTWLVNVIDAYLFIGLSDE